MRNTQKAQSVEESMLGLLDGFRERGKRRRREGIKGEKEKLHFLS